MTMTQGYAQTCNFTDQLTISVGAIPTCGVITQLSSADQTLEARDKITLGEGFSVDNSASTHTFTIKTDNTVIPAAYNQDNINGLTRSLNTSTCVPGTIKGDYTVGPDGEMAYNIPVNISPGTKGMQPDLHILYNSRSGNDILGWNWHLGGISSITRTAKNNYYDNTTSSVQFNNTTDVFSLDGQRLILTGTNTYSPENNPYTRIVFNGTGFTLTTQSGLVMQYGQTATSRITPTGAPLPVAWTINRITDPDGNYVEYTYLVDETSGENIINEIKYTGNNSIAPYNSIKFAYSRRNDPNTVYIGGYPLKQALRLDAIRVYSENNMSKEYTFSYSSDGTYNKLNQISLVDEGITYNPTIINWGSTDLTNVSTIDAGSSSSSGVQLGSLNSNKVYFGDFNGDGITDIVKWNKAQTLNIAVSNETATPITLTSTPLDIDVMDWNNDGKDEIAVHLQEGTSDIVKYYSVSNGSATLVDQKTTTIVTGASCSYLYGDFNADGIIERLMIYGFGINGLERFGNVSVMTACNLSSYTINSVKLIDYNGDGKPEILANACSPYSLSSLKSSVMNYPTPTITCGDYILSLAGTTLTGTLIASGANNISSMYIGDFNGDGIPDILSYNYTSTWSLLYGTGNGYVSGTVPSSLSSINPTSSTTKIKITDINGDGKSDIIYALNGTVNIILSSGYNSFRPVVPKTVSTATGITDVFLDVVDLPLSTASVDPVQIVYGNNIATESYKLITFNTLLNGNLLMNAITDGFNNTTNITFAFATTATTTTPLAEPMRLIKGKMLLPIHLTKTNGTSTLVDNTYTFANAYQHTLAGFMGFTSLTATEAVTGVSVTSTYQLSISNGTTSCLNSWMDSRVVKSCTNTSLSTSSYTAQAKGGDMSKKLFYPIVSHSETTNNITGTTTISDISSFDANLGVPTITTKTVDGWTFTNNNSYTQVENNKIKISQSMSTSTKGTASYSTTTNYTYDNTYPMRVVSSSNQAATTTFAGFDSYGNATTSTVTPTGSSSGRTSSWTYDTYGRFITSSTDPRGYTSHTQYRASDGSPLSSTNYNNLSSNYSYNNDGGKYVTSVTMPDGTITTDAIGWDNSGTGLYYSQHSESNGNTQTRYYNNKFQLSKETVLGLNGVLMTKTYTYNDNGMLASETDNAGRTLSYGYETTNCSGRIIRKTSNDFNIDLQYSYSGNSVTETDLKDNTTSTSTYDGAGNLITSDGSNGKVDYEYYPSGKLKSSTTMGKVTSMTYDPVTLNQLTLTDPDLGTTTFTYNGYGQMLTKTDAKSQVTTYVYDNSGRTQSVSGTNMNLSYTYSNTPGSLGLVQSVTRDGITESYTYDVLNRPLTTTTSGPVRTGAANTNFTTTFTYDPATSRLASVNYPTGLSLKYAYDAVGNLIRIDNAAGGNIWTGNSANTGNQWTQFTLGNGLITSLEYGTDGLMTAIKTGTSSTPTSVQNLGYTYNASKQLTQRTDGLYGLSEDFTYDAQNRLTSDGLTGQPQYLHQYTYEANGNIKTSSVAGNYNYNAIQPHAVSSVDGIVTATSSNSAPSLSCTSTYNIENKTATIDNGTFRDEFTYGINGNRFRLDLKTSGGTLQGSKVYVDESEFGYNAAGTSTYKRTIITAPTGVCAVWQDSAGVQQIFYIHTDRQGSWLAISNQSGTVTNRYSYDAWGRARDVTTWYLKTVGIVSPTNNLAALQPRFDHGYTGQEHMSAFGLINMNGRIYDPYLQRFISPDPYVQDPSNAQNYNRYSYCMNNPLMYTDPSGYKWKIFKKIGNAVSAVGKGVANVATSAGKAVLNVTHEVMAMPASSVSYVCGFADGAIHGNNVWKEADRCARNSYRITAGLFDKNLKELAWQLPQIALGYGTSQALNFAGNVKEVSQYDGATLVETYSQNWSGSAFTLGSYIDAEKGVKADPNDKVFQHEYGHYLQSQSVGWAYITGYALPSVFGDPNNDPNLHDFNPIEQDANARAIRYFHNKIGNDLKWDFYFNPLGNSRKNWLENPNNYDTPEFQSLLNNSIVKPKWYDSLGMATLVALPFSPLTLFAYGIPSIYHSLYYRKHNVYNQ